MFVAFSFILQLMTPAKTTHDPSKFVGSIDVFSSRNCSSQATHSHDPSIFLKKVDDPGAAWPFNGFIFPNPVVSRPDSIFFLKHRVCLRGKIECVEQATNPGLVNSPFRE